jgi:hypothetical protein
MRIDGSSVNATNVSPNSANANRLPVKSSAVSAPAEDAVYAPTSDLAAYLAELAKVPVVRPDVVSEVQKKVQSGETETPEAKQQTVAAILASSSEE